MAEEKHITIYSWGNQRTKHAPQESEWNLNVTGITSYKPHGVNLKKINGLDDRLQEIIARSKHFEMYHKAVLDHIKQGKRVISVNCHQGRHRSVAFAELMKSELKEMGYTVTCYHTGIGVRTD